MRVNRGCAREAAAAASRRHTMSTLMNAQLEPPLDTSTCSCGRKRHSTFTGADIMSTVCAKSGTTTREAKGSLSVRRRWERQPRSHTAFWMPRLRTQLRALHVYIDISRVSGVFRYSDTVGVGRQQHFCTLPRQDGTTGNTRQRSTQLHPATHTHRLHCSQHDPVPKQHERFVVIVCGECNPPRRITPGGDCIAGSGPSGFFQTLTRKKTKFPEQRLQGPCRQCVLLLVRRACLMLSARRLLVCCWLVVYS